MVKDLRKKYLTFNENTSIKTIFRPYMETAPRYVVQFSVSGFKANYSNVTSAQLPTGNDTTLETLQTSPDLVHT